jgi:ABC-type multidrug transport system ATPase subunit
MRNRNHNHNHHHHHHRSRTPDKSILRNNNNSNNNNDNNRVHFSPTVHVIEHNEQQPLKNDSINATTNAENPIPINNNSPPIKRRSWRYYDDSGRGPIARFLRPDDPTVAYPTARVSLMLFFGFVLSAWSLWLSEDEFFLGVGVSTSESALLRDGEDPTVGSRLNNFPVHIAFKDIGCHIPGVGEILRNVTGAIPSGKLTGILGESGSGKTTFAFQLLGRGQRICKPSRGTVYMNGIPRSLEAFTDRVGYVPQQDVLYPELSVEEVILFSAQWRLPRTVSDMERYRRVEETIRVLGLEKVRSNQVGPLSGGEKRRVSIGMELVANPSVLVLDEPTSGLDSYAAFSLVKILKDIVRTQNVSVVAVLHQPSPRVYNLLERVILLSHGMMVFSGPRNEALPYFQQHGYVFPYGMYDTSHSWSQFLYTSSTSSSSSSVIGGDDNQSNNNDDIVVDDRSVPEWIMDVLAGVEQPKTTITDNNNNNNDNFNSSKEVVQRLAEIWSSNVLHKEWDSVIVPEMERFKRAENESFARVHSHIQSNRIRRTFLSKVAELLGVTEEYCASDPSHGAELRCVVLNGAPFPVLPRPGLRRQVHLWFWQLVSITLRRGLFIHLFVCSGLAGVVALVRSYNMVWSRRPGSNFLLSIAICLLGSVGSIFADDIEPVQRAAGSGMILAAHELAYVAHTLIYGWFMCHWFSLSYFSVLWLRTGVWLACPFSFYRYYSFAHLLHMHFLVSSGLGSLISSATGHRLAPSFLISIGTLVHVHVFSLYSPNRSQLLLDSKFFFTNVDLSRLTLLYSKYSSVTYFLEAVALWEPDRTDIVGREYVLRYFGYKDEHFLACVTSMFALWCLTLSLRFILFAMANGVAYHSSFDLPLFGIFVAKVLILHATALVMMTVVHETVTAAQANFNQIQQQQQLQQQTVHGSNNGLVNRDENNENHKTTTIISTSTTSSSPSNGGGGGGGAASAIVGLRQYYNSTSSEIHNGNIINS